MSQKNYDALLEEMLELADIQINEADEDEVDTMAVEPEADDAKDEPADSEDKDSEDDEKKSDEPEEELTDEWEKDFKTGSKFKIQIHENYAYVWYRNKKSPKIKISPKLKPYKSLVSSFLEEVLSHVEKAS